MGRKDDDKRFADLVGDVDRRVDRAGRLPPDAGTRPQPPRNESRAGGQPPPQFVQPDASQPLLAYAGGVDRATFRRLRDGRIEPEAEIDLHGLASRDARAHLEEGVADSRLAGRRALLVVHGRGQHSQAGPVLRAALPSWLREAPLAHQVLAFAPASAQRGGAGATILLLRRQQEQEEG